MHFFAMRMMPTTTTNRNTNTTISSSPKAKAATSPSSTPPPTEAAAPSSEPLQKPWMAWFAWLFHRVFHNRTISYAGAIHLCTTKCAAAKSDCAFLLFVTGPAEDPLSPFLFSPGLSHGERQLCLRRGGRYFAESVGLPHTSPPDRRGCHRCRCNSAP